MEHEHIIITRKIPRAGMDVLAGEDVSVRTVQEDEERGLAREELLDAVRSCDVLLCQLTEPDRKSVV